MPAAKHQSTLMRQWELLKLIPNTSPGKTAEQLLQDLLAEGYAVTKRTIERDLKQLEPLFPLRCNDTQKPYGWYWVKGRRVEFGGTSQIEAIGMSLTRNVLEGLLPHQLWEGLDSRFAQADKLLDELKDNPNTQWSDFVCYEPPGMSFEKPDLATNTFETIQKALLDHKRLQILHKSANADEAKTLTISPLGLLIQGVRPYLVGCFSEEHKPFLYAIQRIEQAEILDERATPPKGFSLKRFSEQGGGQHAEQRQTITLKASVSEKLANILKETPLNPTQKLTKRKDRCHLSVEVQDSWQLEFWLLSQGPRITVKSPSSLRKRLIDSLEEALQQYQ